MAKSKKFKETDTYFDAEGIFDFTRNRKQSELNMEVSIGYGGIKTYIPAANNTAFFDTANALLIPKGNSIVIASIQIEPSQVAENLYVECGLVLAENNQTFLFELDRAIVSDPSARAGYWRKAQCFSVVHFEEPTNVAMRIWVDNHAGKPISYEIAYLNFS